MPALCSLIVLPFSSALLSNMLAQDALAADALRMRMHMHVYMHMSMHLHVHFLAWLGFITRLKGRHSTITNVRKTAQLKGSR